MIKYDDGTFEFSKSHLKIISKIKPGTKILECGCSTGYMTKYLTEKMNCEVFIIEYDEISCNIAMNYAKDGICSDLMSEEWIIKFKGFKFDYILFADVLEHVYNPELVLRKASALLKDDGKIIVSIPNIAHNDILTNLFYDDFQYTKNGLLDETHIRFYCEKNLDVLFKQAGMQITELDFNTHTNKHTEQKLKTEEPDERLLDLLETRKYGNVYQFIIVSQSKHFCALNKIEKKVNEIEEKKYLCNLFFSETDKFIKDNRMPETIKAYEQVEKIFDVKNKLISFLRFDPIEGYSCILKDLKLECDGQNIEILNTNGIISENLILFQNKDPQIIFKVDQTVEEVKVSFLIYPLVNNRFNQLMKDIFEKNARLTKIEKLKNEIEIIFSQSEKKLNSKIEKVEEENLLFKNEIEKLNILIQQEKEDNLEKVLKLNQDYINLTNTISWKITAPLRTIKKIFSRV